MAENSKRKAFLILALAFSLIIAFFALVVAVVNEDELRERLGVTFYIVGFSILGCVLLVLAGYVWDSSLMTRLRTLRSSVPIVAGDAADAEPDHDEIIGLARNIERMAQALQKTEAMGGSISVDRKPGEGTTFRFSLLTDYEKGDPIPPFPMRSGQAESISS